MGTDHIDLSWTDNSDNEDGFILDWSPNGTNTWTQLANQTSTTFSHTFLTCGTTYYYRVRAYNAGGDSGYATGSATTEDCGPIISSLYIRSALGYDGDITEKTEFSNSGGTVDRMSTVLSVGDTNLDQQVRGILHFNTSAVPANAVITRVTVRLRPNSFTGDNPYDTHRYLVVDIKEPYFGASPNLQTDDFKAPEEMAVACTIFKTGVDWYMCVLKGTAYQYINRDGITQFRLRFQTTDNDDMDADLLNFWSGERCHCELPADPAGTVLRALTDKTW